MKKTYAVISITLLLIVCIVAAVLYFKSKHGKSLSYSVLFIVSPLPSEDWNARCYFDFSCQFCDMRGSGKKKVLPPNPDPCLNSKKLQDFKMCMYFVTFTRKITSPVASQTLAYANSSEYGTYDWEVDRWERTEIISKKRLEKILKGKDGGSHNYSESSCCRKCEDVAYDNKLFLIGKKYCSIKPVTPQYF